MAIVTRDTLQSMLDSDNNTYIMHVVGRALVAIFKRQTAAEQESNATDNLNGIGFTGADAYSGSLTAKYYMKHKVLRDWQLSKWTKRSEKTGYSRLTKYHKQLNEIAEAKAQKAA